MHAEVRVADTVIMIADAGGDYPSFPVWLHVCVSHADVTYRAALQAGGVSVQEPVRKEHDTDKRGGFKDPAGNTWRVATQGGMIRKTFGGLLLHNFEPGFLDHRIRQHFLRNLF